MANRHTIDVTQEDIDQALRKDSSRCVVATAVARAFPKASRIQVDVYGIKMSIGDRRHTYLTPPKVHEYIVGFDAGDTIHPFRFSLDDTARVTHRRKLRTDPGKEVDRARTAERYAKKVAAKIEAEETATPAKREVAREKVAAAEARRRVVEAEAKAQPKSVMEDIPESEVPREKVVDGQRNHRVFRRGKERVYGARVLRVNNDNGPSDFRGPLDVEEPTGSTESDR
jgi:hypothetical protein